MCRGVGNWEVHNERGKKGQSLVAAGGFASGEFTAWGNNLATSRYRTYITLQPDGNWVEGGGARKQRLQELRNEQYRHGPRSGRSFSFWSEQLSFFPARRRPERSADDPKHTLTSDEMKCLMDRRSTARGRVLPGPSPWAKTTWAGLQSATSQAGLPHARR